MIKAIVIFGAFMIGFMLVMIGMTFKCYGDGGGIMMGIGFTMLAALITFGFLEAAGVIVW